MNIIKTIDLWIEAKDNHYEGFDGAFVDGFSNDKIAFDKYKVIKNCNCIIESRAENIIVKNKHHAIIFYKDNKPVRLMVANKNTDVDKCISVALNQYFGEGLLSDLYKKYDIKREDIDLNEEPIFNGSEDKNEIDVGSCDRWNLLYNMLKGFYTEDESDYGNFANDKYYFIPNLFLRLSLTVENEQFEINHKCAFINTIETRLIPIQENSSLTGLGE